VLDRLARRVAPPSVKRHAAEQAAERERREQAWREEQAARVAEQRAKLDAGEAIRCECCLQPITKPKDTAERYMHAAQVLFPGAAERSEVRMFRDLDE
jgi:hypothetical protein